MKSEISNVTEPFLQAACVEQVEPALHGDVMGDERITPATTRGFIAVIGPSGCGKTTWLKSAIRGFLANDCGTSLGYVPQTACFHGALSVGEVVQMASQLRGAVTAEVSDWACSAAGVERLRSRANRDLSGGERRRLAIAEELTGEPATLFLDELTSGLDELGDREIMVWLRELASSAGKHIFLVTHFPLHLEYCDAVLLIIEGKPTYLGPIRQLLADHQAEDLAEVFRQYRDGERSSGEWAVDEARLGLSLPPQAQERLGASWWKQLQVLMRRQALMFRRDRGQLWMQLALAISFPMLVAVFAYQGLPAVRELSLGFDRNIVEGLAERLQFLQSSFQVASLVSGLAMLQVILLTLSGANNGAREIAKEREIVGKEQRAGLSSGAYLGSKVAFVMVLCAAQAFWMAWFVKTVCGFPGDLFAQFAILFATTFAMSCTCLAISAACSTSERASLLGIYLVGFQLPLSGAALALPEWLAWICRPFIAAYWGWSGYLQTLNETRHFDLVKQATETPLADYDIALGVLGIQVVISLFVAWIYTGRIRQI